jgi:iron complex outermembrane recepter protein
MNKILLAFTLLAPIHTNAQIKLVTGVVRDAETKAPLPFCNVLLHESNQGVIADFKGNFKLTISSNLENPKLIFTYSGYEADTVLVDEIQDVHVFYLKSIQNVLDEIVVTTGVSKATLIRENPVSIISVSAKTIDKTIESNIIDVLVKNVAGLNAVKTGPNVSKPFIRGLGYNRVLTLYDGIRQEGQQWGDEHGIEIDAYNIDKAEVIKGPASLMYGSDALAGVISIFPNVPKEKDGIIRGKLISEYQTNNGLIGNGLRFNFSNQHWLFALRGSYRIAKNYTNNIDGRVYNTGFQEKNLSFLTGHTSSKGHTHFNITFYDNLQGIPDGSRDSLTRKLTQQIYEGDLDDITKRPIVSTNQLNSYTLSPLHQRIQHYRIYFNNHYQLGNGEIDATLAFQQNVRREFNHPAMPAQPGLFVRLNTINYGIKYLLPEFKKIELTIGTNGMEQNNKNKKGTDFPIPDYSLFDIGSYVFGKWKHHKLTISGGFRFDLRILHANDFYVRSNPQNGFEKQVFFPDTLGAELQFPELNKTFHGASYSIGGTYRLTQKINLKANIARGYRSPGVIELASNGLDPGAHIVYLGNRNFIPEFSLQQDLGFTGDFKNFSAGISLFNNHIQNYIYLKQMADNQGNAVADAQGNKTFQYEQSSAQLYGTEATFDFHPECIKGFNFNNSFSMIYGVNRKNDFRNKKTGGEYLPLIPPAKISSSISKDFTVVNKTFSSFNLKAEMEYSAAQNRFLALYNTETATPQHTLFNLATGINIIYDQNKILQIHIQVNNLFDVAYQSNLSRLKYFEYYEKSPKSHYGIYNMGRNICAKMIVPL